MSQMIKFEKARKSSIGLAAVVNFNAGVRVPGTETSSRVENL